MITCLACGNQYKAITNTHLKKHGMTTIEYREHYGAPLLSAESAALRRKPQIDWGTLDLGKRPDAVIAREVGLRREEGGKARRLLNIPAFVGLILTQEGDPCRSIYEAMYDAILHWQQQSHEHEVPVAGLPYISDFLVDGKYVEIAGMIGFGKYAKKHEMKKLAYEDAGIPSRWLTPQEVQDLFQGCPVALRFRAQRMCLDCGVETHDLVKGVCRKCYNRRWHQTERAEMACAHCGRTFSYDGQTRRAFCSLSCYHKSMGFAWPSWDWIDEQLRTTSARQLAFRIGVKPATLYMRLHRRRKGATSPVSA